MKVFISALLLAFLAGCATAPPDPAEQILGRWQSEVGGFSVVTTYTVDQVIVDGFEPRTYVLEGGRLVIDSDQISARQVSFPSSDEMVQVDGITETAHTFTRIDG